MGSVCAECRRITPNNVLGTEANRLAKVKRLVWGKNRNLTSLFLLE